MALLKAAAFASFAFLANAQWNASQCMDFSATEQGDVGVGPGDKQDTCWKHMEWAMSEGLKEDNQWYPPGTSATPTDVQCALFLMSIGQNGPTEDGHSCNKAPCQSISTTMAEGGKASHQGQPGTCAPPIVQREVTETKPEAGPSMQWWMWLLLVAAILALIGLLAFFLMKKPAPKKKRAVMVKAPEPTPEPPVMTTVTEVPTYYQVAPPVITSVVQAPPVVAAPQFITEVVQAPPVYTEVVQAPPVYAAPQVFTEFVQAPPVYAGSQVVTAPGPVYAAAPVSTISAPGYQAPVTYAAPVSTVAMPVTYA